MAIRDSERKQGETMRRARIMGLAAFVAAVAMAITAGSACGAVGNTTFDFSFGSTGTGGGKFQAPTGVAINQDTGDVYVTDRTLHRVSKFDADGNFILMWGRGVDQDTGSDICTAASGHICQAGAAGSASGWFSAPTGIGVNSNTGDVYVHDVSNFRVQKFDANGNFILTWGKGVNQSTGGNLCTAISGNVCKSGIQSGDNSTTPPTPSEPGVFAPGGGDVSLAVDNAGYVYVTETASIPNPRVQKFDSDGTFVGMVSPVPVVGDLRGVHSPAVDAGGNLYASHTIFLNSEAIRIGHSAFTPDGAAPAERTFGSNNYIHNVTVDPSNQFLVTIASECLSTPGIGVPPALVSDYGTMHIVEYHPSSQEVDCTVPAAMPNTRDTRGVAASGTHRLYVALAGSHNEIQVFNLPVATPPDVGAQSATGITSNKAVIKAQIAANLDDTTFHIEFGTSPCSDVPNPCASTSESNSIGAAYVPKAINGDTTNLTPDTTYYYRVVASNGAGSNAGSDQVFHTYPNPTFDPSCPNNLARQQTRAAFLLDCRAYELVSAENQGGYNVESDLVPGQIPFAGYPQAKEKALYAIHNGGIPGTGKPTNRGPDPYVATRDAEHQRWSTEYVGVPADAPSTSPFSSPVAGADSGLSNFAFAGGDVCDPCFADGSKGIPIHKPDGSLVQGMSGSIDVPTPEPAGGVKKHFSADGSHFLFASKQQFEPEGNNSGTDTTIYSRNLDTDTTEVVSTDTSGTAIADGESLAELDVSSDGSRVLFGDLVSTDSEGNDYYHLYLHIAGTPESLDLTPGVTSGALYAGMTSDASLIYFTTPDSLASDGDTSADLYSADVDENGSVITERVSTGTGGAGNTDSCDPAGNSYNPSDWNTIPGGPTDCSVVAVGGQGGVASSSGAVYFLSPEQLDGNGVDGAPNLFLAKLGSEPKFVETLESGANSPVPPAAFNLKHTSGGSFENAEGVAIDAQDGSTYVYDISDEGGFDGPGSGYVQKFDASGKQDANFADNSILDGSSSGGVFATTGSGGDFGLPVGIPTSLAVDNYPGSASYGDLYVPETGLLPSFESVVDIRKFDSSGNYESTITVGDPSMVDFVTAVAVDQSSGDLYAGVFSGFFGNSTIKIFSDTGAPVSSFSTGFNTPLGIAVDSSGKVYVANGSATRIYIGGVLQPTPLDSNASYGVTVDPSNDHVFVDEGSKVVEYDSTGTLLGDAVGAGSISGSVDLDADSGRLIVSNTNSGNVKYYESGVASDPSYDHPLVIDSVKEAATRHTTDFQTNASGEQAVFPSVQSLTGFDNAGKYELFRYDVSGSPLACLSCNTTNEFPVTDAAMASNGLSLTDDGRVFFNTGESLVLRDTNAKRDAYEWKDGEVELISSGQDRSDSGLLTVSTDGKDAFFFTRETLASNDHNGTLMKLYDAREQGGFFVIPSQPSCKASDECHGPGTQASPPAPLGTLKGTLGNLPEPPVCNLKSLSKSAKSLSHRAKALRRRAAHSTGKHAKALRRKAHKFATKAKGGSKATKRCRARIRRSK